MALPANRPILQRMFVFLLPAGPFYYRSTRADSSSPVSGSHPTQRAPNAMNRNAHTSAFGFTLIEMMVTITILGILTALAAPSFASLVDRWRVIETAESLQSTIYFARSEAIKRGGRVSIQKIANNTDGCTLAKSDRDWGCGWFVYADTTPDNTWSDGTGGKPAEEILMRVRASQSTDVNLSVAGVSSIAMSRWGLMTGPTAVGAGFTVSATRDKLNIYRTVCISSGGRVRVVQQLKC